MFPEHVLVGWLVFIRMQWGREYCPHVPPVITDQLVARGWFTQQHEGDWQGVRNGHVTDAGCIIADLESPAWGVDPIPSMESEA